MKTGDFVYINIHKSESGIHYFKNIPIAPCPFCNGVELIVREVGLDEGHPLEGSDQVACGGCGTGGPWTNGEEEAVKKWNDGLHYEHQDLKAEWLAAANPAVLYDYDLPF